MFKGYIIPILHKLFQRIERETKKKSIITLIATPDENSMKRNTMIYEMMLENCLVEKA